MRLKKPDGSCVRSPISTTLKEDYGVNGAALRCEMPIAPVRVRPFAEGSIGSCNAGTSQGASCQRARWARQSATHWANGSHCRFISKTPKSRSIITWSRTRSGPPVLAKRIGYFSGMPMPDNVALLSTRSSKVADATVLNPTLISTMSLAACRP